MGRNPTGHVVPEQVVYDGETKLRKLADGTFRGTVNPVPVFTDNKMVAGWLMIHTMVLPADGFIHVTLLPFRGIRHDPILGVGSMVIFTYRQVAPFARNP